MTPLCTAFLVQLPLPPRSTRRLSSTPSRPRRMWTASPPVECGPYADRRAVLPALHSGGLHPHDRVHGHRHCGKNAVVIGRSNIVGKPAALLLLAKNATVTICHSRTKNLKEVCAAADILVAAVGREGFVTGDMVKPGAVVIDVGINAVRTASCTAMSILPRPPRRPPTSPPSPAVSVR